mgnify:CR=1 FL=1
MLACLGLVSGSCSAEDKEKGYAEAKKMFASIDAASAMSGEKPLAPLVKSESEFDID